MTSRIVGASVCVLLLTSAALVAQPLSVKTVSAAQALRIVEAARAKCRERKLGEISVAVVDRAGNVKLLFAGDNSNPHTVELSRRKAYTARTFGIPSLEFAKRTNGATEFSGQRFLADVIPLGGGLPILLGTEKIGGLGISGAPRQEDDEKCAKAGLDAVAAFLK